MKKIDWIFVVLTYKNCDDLRELVNNIKENFKNYKIVVVNSYFDDGSYKRIKAISEQYNCDFLNVENKGYGYGNNRGIEYCSEHYDFDYLVVANPDILFTHNDFKYVDGKTQPLMYAPYIENLRGKKQNPYWAVENKYTEYMIYNGYKNDNKLTVLAGIAINKMIREFFVMRWRLFGKKNHKIFAAHGSCVIFTKAALKLLNQVYDENMFLFAEEALLAHKAKLLNILTVLTSAIGVKHKEDGSMSISNICETKELKKSVIYYYELIKGWRK